MAKSKLLPYDLILSSDRNMNGIAPIHCAAKTGNTSILKLLLENGADPNAVATLLEAGADVEAGAKDFHPFFTAIQTRNLGILELIIKYLDPLKLKSGSFLQAGHTPLQCAVLVESLEIVEFLLKNGALVNHYVQGDFPLHFAIDLRNQEIVSKLIEHGAHVSKLCLCGGTALFHAITKNDIQMCKLLLKKGATLKEKDKDGFSVLHYAIFKRSETTMIKFLVECGADLNEIVDGVLPIGRLIRCAMTDHAEQISKGNTKGIQDNDEIVAIFKLLLEHGSPLTKPGCPDNEGVLFMKASLGVYVTGLKLLINYGTDFEKCLKVLRRNFCNMIIHLRQRFRINMYDVEKIFNLDSSENNRNILLYPRMGYTLFRNQDFRQECERFRKGARIMTQAIAKIEACGMELKEEHLWLVNRIFSRSFYQRCKEEIKEMKSTVISGRITFFDIISASVKKITVYARNADIIEAIQGLDSGKLFPLYSEDMRHQIKRGVDRNNLLEMSLEILNKTSDTKIHFLAACEIFNYLSLIDLRNLCRIYNSFIFVSADPSNF